MRLDDDALISNVRWLGFIEFPHTSIFDFELAEFEGHCKLWIGDKLVLDTEGESIFGSFEAIENILYEIKIEYSLVRDLELFL